MTQKDKISPKIIGQSRLAESCPYCQAKDFVKRGVRKNRYQLVQLYLCRNPECGRTFTAQEIKGRHEALQRFMLANDSCTVATEVPVYIRKEDVEHMENVLNFKINERPSAEIAGSIKPDFCPLSQYGLLNARFNIGIGTPSTEIDKRINPDFWDKGKMVKNGVNSIF